jgi:hypothetical protein
LFYGLSAAWALTGFGHSESLHIEHLNQSFFIKNYGCLKLKWSDFGFYFFYLSSLFFLSLFVSLISLFIYENRWKKIGNSWDFIFYFLFYEYWIEINEQWDEQSVRANIIGGSKKINVRLKKSTELFSNGFLKEPLLNTPFNNSFRHRTVVKDSV